MTCSFLFCCNFFFISFAEKQNFHRWPVVNFLRGFGDPLKVKNPCSGRCPPSVFRQLRGIRTATPRVYRVCIFVVLNNACICICRCDKSVVDLHFSRMKYSSKTYTEKQTNRERETVREKQKQIVAINKNRTVWPTEVYYYYCR